MRTAMMAFLVLSVRLLADEPPQQLPKSWHGTLVITAGAGKETKVPMSLTILPQEKSDILVFKITYGEGDKKQVRSYELKPHPEHRDRFIIDEKNGILIDVRLVGDTLYCPFQVNDQIINDTRYRMEGGRMIFELIVIDLKQPRISQLKGGKFEVKSHVPQVVQQGILRKQDVAK